jgi:hypothetical protein
MALPTNPDRQHSPNSSPEAAPTAVVSQPTKLDLGGQLGPLLAEIGRISESSPAGPSNDGPGATGGAVQTSGSGTTPVMSARDQAIANLPATRVMQKQLEAHIRTEIKKLRKQAKTVARINQPGGAYRLNMLYLRIHHLNALLHELLSSSVEVLKRLFIKVFIDKQTVL